MDQPTFDHLGLVQPILQALQEEGYEHPTPIQTQAIPHLLQRRDLLGCAQTGTGKTAAFAIPILQLLKEKQTQQRAGRPIRAPIRALILTPTRELAIQIDESFAAYGRHCHLQHAVIFGGVGQKPQTDALQSGIDILTATPGRLLDLMQQGFVKLEALQMFVLDEADRMLDMGFIHDVKRVIANIPKERQTLLFSATMPNEIAELSQTILRDPVRIDVAPVSSTADTVEQKLYFVEKPDKPKLLVHLLQDERIDQILVFSRTKHGANKLVKILDRNGINASAIHGNKSQTARQNALKGFKQGKVRVLVATDIAARGIDIDDLAHVLNYDLPNVPETYVHRIGRTGRAGSSGLAISFCNMEERAYLRDIQKLIRKKVPVVTGHPHESDGTPRPQDKEPIPGSRRRKNPGRSPRPPRGKNDRAEQERSEHRSVTTPPNRRSSRKKKRRPEQQNKQAESNRRRNDRSKKEHGLDRRANDPEQNTQKSSAANPDYAAMTRELFGEVLPELKKEGSSPKKNKRRRGRQRGR